MELGAIQAATQDLYELLKILAGEHVQAPDLNYQTGSSHYASATSEPDSDSPRAPQRQPKERQIPTGRTTSTTDSTGSSKKLDGYFQMAMNRFLKEQNLVTVQPPPLGTQDVDMESIGTPDQEVWEADDLWIPSSSGHNSGRAAVATAAIASGNSSSLIQRVRISAISDLKEFTGKDMDEDRA
ncbi:hypothetical protein PHMEG_00036746 [Phytophthora megakarya]|uniref:Eukaryotic/viral aspartic protease n=1 Tax=Phytophthora megakarya TaxID=4795 RepID=A0A225UL86_9STRA|nr:hypothetical protein PHMEG_00036746 [Phytophthora megakarya]